jgi:hypothetical protein
MRFFRDLFSAKIIRILVKDDIFNFFLVLDLHVMRRNVLFLSFFVVLILSGYSCKDKKAGEQKVLTLMNSSLKIKTYLNDDPTKQYLDIDVSLEYPVKYPDSDILKKVRKIVLLDFYPEADSNYINPDDAVNAYIEDYKKFFVESETAFAEETSDAESDDSSSGNPWINIEKMIVHHNADNLFSYTIYSDRYTGGAHGGKNYLNTVIDMKNGEKITEDDLFTESAKPLIIKMIVDKIMSKQKVGSIAELEDIGFFDISEIGLNKNFYLNDKGLVYTFNEYEIAAYAVGAIEVALDFNDISGFLKPGCPIEPLLP